jgi:arylsulfatase A-like enzyme
MKSARHLVLAAVAAFAMGGAAQAKPHNLILFVADGLRARIVTPQTAPAMAALRAEGVDFQNSHSLFPTVTTPNAAAFATGRGLGDTGDFGNALFAGPPSLPAPYSGMIADLEDDALLGLMNARFGGDYLGAESLLRLARAKGYATAAVGKLGPTAVQDVTARDGRGTIVIDDATGRPEDGGLPLPDDVVRGLAAAGLAAKAPDRGLNGSPGAYNMPGAIVPNREQQAWFVGVATRVLLPRWKAEGRPFMMVYWSRDPDGTQHNNGDSLGSLEPGINGPTSMAAIRNADDNLAALRETLARLGLAEDTDIIVVADHGFSTAGKQSATSAAARLGYPDVPAGKLPPGFLSIDLAEALRLPLRDAAGLPVDVAHGFRPRRGGLLGEDAAHPRVVVAPNGGSDLIYLPGPDAPALAQRIVSFLTTQDYVGGVFVRDDLGPVAGALPTSAIGLAGQARTPAPAIVVSFRSFARGCADPELCGVDIADTELQEGQGIHGSFGRQDTHNFMAATGPDFRKGFVDPAPASNADIGMTIAGLLDLPVSPSALSGRMLGEALAGGAAAPGVQPILLTSPAAANGFRTVLKGQAVAGRRYFDAAGDPERVIGLESLRAHGARGGAEVTRRPSSRGRPVGGRFGD